MDQFHILFPKSIANSDDVQAWQLVLRQLGTMVVQNRQSFIDMLEISGGLDIPDNVSDAELIDLFVENAPENEELILGASLTIAHQFQDSSFDGNLKIDNSLAQGTYETLLNGFEGYELDIEDDSEEDEMSNFPGAGMLIGQSLKRMKEMRSQEPTAPIVDPSIEMRKAALEARRKQAAEKKAAAEKLKKQKQTNTIVLVSISVLALGTIAYAAFKSSK